MWTSNLPQEGVAKFRAKYDSFENPAIIWPHTKGMV